MISIVVRMGDTPPWRISLDDTEIGNRKMLRASIREMCRAVEEHLLREVGETPLTGMRRCD